MSWDRTPITMPRTLPPIFRVLPETNRFTVTVHYVDDDGRLKCWGTYHTDNYAEAEKLAHDPELWDWPASWPLDEKLATVSMSITRTSQHIYRTGKTNVPPA